MFSIHEIQRKEKDRWKLKELELYWFRGLYKQEIFTFSCILRYLEITFKFKIHGQLLNN